MTRSGYGTEDGGGEGGGKEEIGVSREMRNGLEFRWPLPHSSVISLREISSVRTATRRVDTRPLVWLSQTSDYKLMQCSLPRTTTYSNV